MEYEICPIYSIILFVLEATPIIIIIIITDISYLMKYIKYQIIFYEYLLTFAGKKKFRAVEITYGIK